MDMIGKVRHMKMRNQLSDGEICRRTGLARNTVKKWLKADGDAIPKYSRQKAQGKLTEFAEVLEQAVRMGIGLSMRGAVARRFLYRSKHRLSRRLQRSDRLNARMATRARQRYFQSLYPAEF